MAGVLGAGDDPSIDGAALHSRELGDNALSPE
jgi:hypothetical protein